MKNYFTMSMIDIKGFDMDNVLCLYREVYKWNE